MTKEEFKEISDFIKSKRFVARKTDGWSFFWSGYVIDTDSLIYQLRKMSRRKNKNVDS